VIDGVQYEPGVLINTHPGQDRLRALKESGRRPLCACAAGAALYVTERSGRCYLAKMPGSGPIHARSCSHYVAATWADGLDAYANDVVTPTARGAKRLKVALDAGRSLPAKAVSLDGLFDFLLQNAGLNRRDAESRCTWSAARERLQTAATELETGDMGDVATQLFVPSLQDKESYALQVASCLEWLKEDRPHHFVVAPMSRFMPSPFGYGLRLKYLPNLTFWIKHAVFDRWAERWYASIREHLLAGTPALAMVQVKPSPKAQEAYATRVAFRFLGLDYLPVSHPSLERDCARLSPSGHIVSPLRFDAPLNHALADLILTDQSSTFPWWSTIDFGDHRIDRPRRRAKHLYHPATKSIGV
jgi:hypothetical protein